MSGIIDEDKIKNEDEIFEADMTNEETILGISDIDLTIELSTLAEQLIYSSKEKWAKDAFVLLSGSAALKIRREIKDYMLKDGIALYEPEDPSRKKVTSGKKPPSLIHTIGKILHSFIKRRLKDSERYTDVKHDISSENRLILRMVGNLIPLLGDRVIKWMGIRKSEKYSTNGRIGYSPEGFRNFLRLAQFIPKELILDEVITKIGKVKPVAYSHYTFMTSYKQEILINHRNEIPKLIEVLNNEIKKGSWTTNHSQILRNKLKQLGTENGNKWPKPHKTKWENYFKQLIKEIIEEDLSKKKVVLKKKSEKQKIFLGYEKSVPIASLKSKLPDIERLDKTRQIHIIDITKENIINTLSNKWQDLDDLVSKLRMKEMLDVRFLKVKLSELVRKQEILHINRDGRDFWKLK